MQWNAMECNGVTWEDPQHIWAPSYNVVIVYLDLKDLQNPKTPEPQNPKPTVALGSVVDDQSIHRKYTVNVIGKGSAEPFSEVGLAWRIMVN